MFLRSGKVSGNTPRFTSNSPQLHHKNTTFLTHIFAKPPVKTAFFTAAKKLHLLTPESDYHLLSKAIRRRKLFYI
jgi:hypothetical protein